MGLDFIHGFFIVNAVNAEKKTINADASTFRECPSKDSSDKTKNLQKPYEDSEDNAHRMELRSKIEDSLNQSTSTIDRSFDTLLNYQTNSAGSNILQFQNQLLYLGKDLKT